jgi:putative copper resistance protein D
MIGPEAALILCRFLFDGAAIVLWGTSSYLATLVPDALARYLGKRLLICHVVAITIVTATTILLLPLRAATIGDGWSDAVDIGTIQTVLLETNVGTAWEAQALFAFLILLAAAVSAPMRLRALAVFSGLLLSSQAMIGHASMDEGWLEALHRINDVLHLLSGGAWLGALLPVLMLIPLFDDERYGPQARIALMRFSTAGHGAVALVIATGVVNMLLIVGGLPLDWSFNYQILLSAKTVLVVVMVLLAVVNRYLFVPRISHYRHGPDRTLVPATIAEITIGAAVVALVAWFGTLEPN